jgi:hypothetical protein
MPATWKRTYVEVYGPDGYEGRWDVDPPEGTPIDEQYRDEMMATLQNPGPDYPDSHAEWIDCGTDLVFGLFHHGARPPSFGPKHTRPYPE